MVAATEVAPMSAPSPVPPDAKTAVVVNGAEKPGSTTAAKSRPKGKNQQRREKRKQKKLQSSRESSVATESESESVCTLYDLGDGVCLKFFLLMTLCGEQESGQASSNVRLSLVPESTPDFKSSDLELDENDPNFAEYKRILERFNVTDVSYVQHSQI